MTDKTITSKSCLTLLVDTSGEDSFGHNLAYSKSFRSVYINLAKNFCFIAPTPNIAKKSDIFLSGLAEYKNIDQGNLKIKNFILGPDTSFCSSNFNKIMFIQHFNK